MALTEEQKLLQKQNRIQGVTDTTQLIYHPYFMILRQPEEAGEYSAIGECDLYGEINAFSYQMGDIIKITEDNDDKRRYFVFPLINTVDGLALVFEMYAKVKLWKGINSGNFDISLYQRWRTFDVLEVEYGSIDGSVKKKVKWNIQEFETKYDSYSVFNLTKDSQYTYNVYQSRGDHLTLKDLL